MHVSTTDPAQKKILMLRTSTTRKLAAQLKNGNDPETRLAIVDR